MKGLDIWTMQGDCLDLMAEIEAGSVDMVLCDPPYGTTGVAAGRTGRSFIRIERDPDYYKIAVKRIDEAYGIKE